MTAKEMFEKLGYEQFNYSNGIRYTDGNTEQNTEFENDGFINIYNNCLSYNDDIAPLLKIIHKSRELKESGNNEKR